MSKAEVTFPSGGGGGTPYALDIQDEGGLQVSNPSAMNFVGDGVSVIENPSGTAEVTIAGGNNVIDVRDGGILAQSNPTYIDFTGGGVSALGFAGGVLVNIPAFDIKDEGVTLISSGNINYINFVGAGVSVTESSNDVTITIPSSTPYALYIEDDGGGVISNPDTINFVGAGVSVSESPSGTAEVTIAGGSTLSINTQTASYTLVLSDAGKLVRMNVASGNFLTIPANSSVAFPVGTILYVEQMGAGTTTIAPAGGVTINSTALNTPYQYGTITLIQVSADVWNVIGATI